MDKLMVVNKRKSFSLEGEGTISDSLSFIEEALQEIGVSAKLTMQTVLLAEELISQFLEYKRAGGSLRVQVKRFFGDISVQVHAQGEAFDAFAGPKTDVKALEELEDHESVQAIRAILLKSQGDKLRISHKNGQNHACIMVQKYRGQAVIHTLIALALGLFFGLFMKYLFPDTVSEGMKTYFLNPVKMIFMNMLGIIIGPVIFFSLASSISQYKDISELGRIGAKVMGVYMLTTVISVFLSMGIFMLLHPGDPGFALTLHADIAPVSVDTDVDISLLHTLIHIIPDNLIKPFIESNTLQIIFLGVLCGAAVGTLGEYAPVLQNFFEACNSLFLTITGMFTRLIPLVVFCSVSVMTVDMGGPTMMYVLGAGGVILLALFAMILFYGFLILVLGRLNPVTFFRKNKEGMLNSLTLASSSAAMPTNMKICTEKLGISFRVCSFSIPLGATVNMDGTCVVLTILGLFLARAYDVTVSGPALVSLIITVILLSLGCPGVPGAGLVCLGVVLGSLGVPIEAIGLIMPLFSFTDMFATMSNTTGDMAATLIVAKSEGLLDLKTYHSYFPH